MLKNITLTAAAVAVTLAAIQPVTSASANGLYVNPNGLEKKVYPAVFLPPKISCKAAKKLVKTHGYKKVRKIECDGYVYTFKAKKYGKKYAIAINAVTKKVWAI